MTAFRFRHFCVDDHECGMKVSSDSVLLAAWFAQRVSPVTRLIDVGGGSGVLSLLITDAWPDVKVTALEVEPGAAAAALANFTNSPWPERLRVVQGNFQDFIPSDSVGAVISNPPYFENGITAPDAVRAVSRHQSELNYITLMKYAAQVLDSDGVIGLVTPAQAEDSVMYAGTLASLNLNRMCRVRTVAGKPPKRLLWVWGRIPGKMPDEELCIRDENGYTRDYRALVEPYYHHLN